jgi:hypothetical protein
VASYPLGEPHSSGQRPLRGLDFWCGLAGDVAGLGLPVDGGLEFVWGLLMTCEGMLLVGILDDSLKG